MYEIALAMYEIALTFPQLNKPEQGLIYDTHLLRNQRQWGSNGFNFVHLDFSHELHKVTLDSNRSHY